MIEDKLGPMPEPVVEPPDDNPGGADAINDDVPFSGDQPVVLSHDLNPDANPGVDEAMPDELSHPEEKQQENEGDDDEEAPG
jgi:hypothetical protein